MHRRAFAHRALQADVAAVTLHDVVRRRQARGQTDPGLALGKAEIEQTLKAIRRDPTPGVGHSDMHTVVTMLGGDRDRTLTVDGGGGVLSRMRNT